MRIKRFNFKENSYRIVCGKGNFYKRRAFRNGEDDFSRDEEKTKMKKYFRLTLVVSIWFIDAIFRFSSFLACYLGKVAWARTKS
jgi:hypothetical protein